MKKKCTQCREVKDVAEFHKDPRGKHGTMSKCGRCDSLRYYRLKYGKYAEIVMENSQARRNLPRVKREVHQMITEADREHLDKIHAYEKYLPDEYQIKIMMRRRILTLID